MEAKDAEANEVRGSSGKMPRKRCDKALHEK